MLKILKDIYFWDIRKNKQLFPSNPVFFVDSCYGSFKTYS